jgi:4-hydroxybenzoate polyprenyltransferase
MSNVKSNLGTTLEMIKIEHTLFALPFAFLGAVLAAQGIPSWSHILWITLAMMGARSTAMAFNRIVDREFDAKNPRTKSRAIPAGILSLNFVKFFTFVSTLLFFISAAMLNQLTLILSPVALASLLFYSYTKRFTSLSHLVLGWCLSIAPTGAWIAVRGSIDSSIPLILSFIVMLWTAGFDILYACQDYEFDRKQGLHSIPAKLGISNALWVSRLLHIITFGLLIYLYLLTNLGTLALLGTLATGLNAAFFTTNAFVSVILFVTFGGAMLIK